MMSHSSNGSARFNCFDQSGAFVLLAVSSTVLARRSGLTVVDGLTSLGYAVVVLKGLAPILLRFLLTLSDLLDV